MWTHGVVALAVLAGLAPPTHAAPGNVTVRVTSFFFYSGGGEGYGVAACTAVADYLPLSMRAYCRINEKIQAPTIPLSGGPPPVSTDVWYGYLPTPHLVCAGVVVRERDLSTWSPPEVCEHPR